LTEEACRNLFADTAFVSTKAFAPTEGTFESSIATLRIKQLIAQRSSKLILLVDSSKFGLRALCKVLGVEAIHMVITDNKCPKNALEALRKAGPQVVVAEPKTG
jgi:DeoR/GlpR family transcriptional regulator of sugar metabolism